MKNLKRYCPICKYTKGDLLHTQTFILDKNNPLPSSYDVVSCAQCSFVFADTEATDADYSTYYQLFSKYENADVSAGGGDTPLDFTRIEKLVDDLIPYLEKDDLILDIGAARGGVLNLLKQKQYMNLYALEPSNLCVQYMKSNNIQAYQGTLNDNLEEIFHGKKFDFIILSHVFEHIYDLNTAMHNISSILQDNGKVYIEVPNANQYIDFFVVPYYYFDIEHINHFEQDSLTRLLGLHGYKTEAMHTKSIFVTKDKEYPAFFGIFKKITDIQKNIIEYVNLSESENYEALLKPLLTSKESIAIWGAGNFTKRLLSQSILDQCNIKIFIDKDHIKQTQTIHNIKIYHPEKLKVFNGTIIIISAFFSEDILQEIKDMHLKNEIIILK